MIVSPEMLSKNKMYPWLNEEFKDVANQQRFLKLIITQNPVGLIREK